MADQAQATTRGPRARPAPRAPRTEDDGPRQTESNILFVAGFPQDTDAQVVGTLFEKYGAVKHVRLSRGVGRVEFEGDEAAQKSLSLNGTDYEGSKLRVELHFKRRRFQRTRVEGDRPPRAPRAEGDRPPRAPRADGDRPPRAPRADGDRPPRAPRADGDRPPRAPRAEGDRPPRAPRAPRAEGDRPPRAPRAPRAVVPAGEQKPLDPCNIFVGRVYPETEDSAIQAVFAAFGAVVHYERARSRRFALIKYGSAAEAAKAIATGATLEGQALRVEPENPNNKAPRAPRVDGDRPPRERRPVDPATLDAKRLFFGFLPENTVASAITSNYTGVTNVELRGKYGYVTFDSDASAAAALSNPTKIGAEVKVEVAQRTARPRRPRPVNTTA